MIWTFYKKIKMVSEIKKINIKLDKILKNQQKILREEKVLEELERKELNQEDTIISSEKEALRELEKIGENLKKNISSPLRTITKKDIAKGIIGAFIGIVGHYAFLKGKDFAESLTFSTATGLYIISFLMLVLMLYYTGFRTIEKKIIVKFLPMRATILYLTAIGTIFFVYVIFGILEMPLSFEQIYKLIGANIILASLGSGTADLIGGDK